MPQRIIHCAAGHEKLLAPVAHASLGKCAGGIVAAVADEGALSLLRSSSVSLLFFSKESYDHYLRQLAGPDRDEALQKRLAQWAPEAVNQGVDWLYRGERRILALTASTTGAGGQSEPFEKSMIALDRLVNERAYGSVFMPAMLVHLLLREALLVNELSIDQLVPEASERNQFSLAIAGELKTLGRPEFAQHLPYAEAMRAAFVTPRDAALVGALKSSRLPFMEWRDGLVSTFGIRDLESMSQPGKYKTRVLYPDGRQFHQDLADFTPRQMHREFEERSQAGPMPFWTDHLNFLRLETALMRRAAQRKAAGAENSRLAALLSAQIRKETGLLLTELAAHPSWLNAVPAKPEEDLPFLVQFSAIRGPEDVHGRYRSFADLKARQTR